MIHTSVHHANDVLNQLNSFYWFLHETEIFSFVSYELVRGVLRSYSIRFLDAMTQNATQLLFFIIGASIRIRSPFTLNRKALFLLQTQNNIWLIYVLPDVNECSADSNPCDDNADCSNTEGSYSCSCKSGFTGNGTTCQGT